MSEYKIMDMLEEDEYVKKTFLGDKYARNKLIPNDLYSEYLKHSNFSEKSILSFAQNVNRDPGIIVGRLQHDGLISKDDAKLNTLKRKYIISIYN